MHTRNVLLACAILAAAAGIARADQITFSDTIPLANTNWVDSVTVSKFDPALGFLDSIEFELTGHVEGDVQFESLDASPAHVETSLSALIELHRPDNSLLLDVLPAFMTADDVSAFDNVIDFGGTSGRSYLNQSADQMDSSTSPPPASDLTLFTGAPHAPGTITLPVNANATSTASGAGNLLAAFETLASATVVVKYNYTVPEPATFAMLALGTGLIPLRRRRRA